MRRLWRDYRSFSPTARLLMANQLAINIGFYLLMPYLAGYLSGHLRMASAAVGLVLGARNFSQQGMFVLGGWLADRFGCAPLIIAGCSLRVFAFGLLALAHSLPSLIAAAALTGFAGAMFNPAVRAYVAHEAGVQRIEAFAVFNVFYQSGILLGPPLGLLLTGVAFQAACATAAAIFAVLTAVQLRRLPRYRPTCDASPTRDCASTSADGRSGSARALVAFTAAMTGAYVLSFQIYLLLPLAVQPVLGAGGVTLLFAASGLVGVAGQLRVTGWCRTHLTRGASLTTGVAIMTAACAVPALASGLFTTPDSAYDVAVPVAAVLAACLLALGSATTYPFEMDALVALAAPGRVGTCYGIYSTATGLAVAAGNVAVGALSDYAARHAAAYLPWIALVCCGAASSGAVALVTRAQPHHATADIPQARPTPQRLPAGR